MSTGGIIGLTLGLLGALVGFAAAGLGIWLAVRQIRRLRADVEPKIRSGPHGEVVDLPVMQISRVVPGAPMVALGRASGFVSFLIHPHGIEYRILRKKTVPFHEIAEVDAPYQSFKVFTVRFHHQLTALGALATSEYVVCYALWRLSHHCPLTDRARARIHAQP